MTSSIYRCFGKRCFDVLVAAAAIVMFGPLLAVTAMVVRWRLGSPVLFRQQRPGLGGQLFTLLKFRTMTDARGANGGLLPDERRLTGFGRLLRSSSLDELPELWNVLWGDMSLVGPRPWLPRYLRLYTPQQARRHEMRPGITGWAQVNGRNRADWEDRLAMDVWYVERCSLWLDVKILALTLVKVLQRSDVTATGHATMTEFCGTKADDRVVPSPPEYGDPEDSARPLRRAG